MPFVSSHTGLSSALGDSPRQHARFCVNPVKVLAPGGEEASSRPSYDTGEGNGDLRP